METEMEIEIEKEKQKQKEELHNDRKQKTENQKDEVVKARRPLKLSRNNNLDPEKGLRYHFGFGCRELDIVTDPPACYRSPTYATMYGYEEAKIMHQIDRRKLRDMTGRYSYKW